MTEHGVFDLVEEGGHETVAFCHDGATGLRAIIAIHSTVLGPGLGGTRFWPFATEREALIDVLRLSRGMTYKNAAAGLDLGGGKAVIIGDPRRDRTDELMRAYGRAVDSQGGRYLTAEDVGTTQADMDLIKEVTPYATGTTSGSGDPSPATAWGVLWAMKAVADHLWGSESLEGRTVAVAGVGKVGSTLVGHLVEEGAKVVVADVRDAAVAAMVETHGATAVDPEEIHRVACDILSPCALGATLNATTIPEMRCAAVCGCANNQLAEPADAGRLAEEGVLYAPDFVVNAGGVINIGEELRGYDPERAKEAIRGIADTTRRVLTMAEELGITTEAAAERVAEERLLRAGGTNGTAG